MRANDHDQDYSDPYPTLNDPTKIWLYISWNPSEPPDHTLIAVRVIVYQVPPYHHAVYVGMHETSPGEYEYEIALIGTPLGNPAYHDESITVPYLIGRPEYVYAKFTGQGGTARATTVAL